MRWRKTNCFFKWGLSKQTQKSGIDDIVLRTTLPETNIAPENRPSQKEPTVVFQPSMFRCHVSFREGIVFVCFVWYSRSYRTQAQFSIPLRDDVLTFTQEIQRPTFAFAHRYEMGILDMDHPKDYSLLGLERTSRNKLSFVEHIF